MATADPRKKKGRFRDKKKGGKTIATMGNGKPTKFNKAEEPIHGQGEKDTSASQEPWAVMKTQEAESRC